MKNVLSRLREHLTQKPQTFVCLLIFAASVFIYLANQHSISSGDNIPSSLLAFNWLFEHTLNFDNFRSSYLASKGNVCVTCTIGGLPYYLVEASNGHITSTYPIGNAIISFPIYYCFFIFLKLYSAVQNWILHVPSAIPHITDQGFEIYRQNYEKLAAALLTASSVVLFYLCAALKFRPGIALLTAFVYGFATNSWATASQGLWQHGAANFALLSVLLCLLKANRTDGSPRKLLLLLAGIFSGLIPACRPTSILFSIATLVYCSFVYGREVRFFLFGSLSMLLSSSWNFYYFGFSLKNLLIAGYSRFSNTTFTASFYRFTPQQFLEGFFGLLVSSSRGLFIFSPVLLFAIPGIYQVWQWRWRKDEQLLGCLTIAAILIFIQYCFYIIWWGGWCYGPRFLTDILPVLCFSMGYCLTNGLERFQHHRYQLAGAVVLFFCLASLSTSVQLVGVFGTANWDGIPLGNDPGRLWNWQDNQIQRSAHHLFAKLHKPIDKPHQYLRKTDGVIQTVLDQNWQPIVAPIQATPAQISVLVAKLKNKGKTRWYGYETAIGRGEARIQVKFLDSLGQISETGRDNLLYVSGTPKPQNTAHAIGEIIFPSQPGSYQMLFIPVLEGLGEFPKYQQKQQPPYELTATIAPHPS